MSCLKLLCFWKAFGKLSAPIDKLVINFFFLLAIECVKYFVVLLITFGFGYIIFHHGNVYHKNVNSLANDIKSERLSSGLLQNGSFSEYPFIVEIPSNTSAESLEKTHQSKPQKLKEITAQYTSRAYQMQN